MIQYRYDNERLISLHYAEQLKNITVKNIIERGEVISSEEASELANIFWRMVDALVEDSKSAKTICGENNLEDWSEYIMGTFRAYLKSSGYSHEWETASENA